MNKTIFSGIPKAELSYPTDTLNNASASAYKLNDEHALIQLSVTGCFNQTYYSNPEQQLSIAKELALKVSPEILAKIAVYSRTKAYMKDMPAFLLAVLSKKDSELFKAVFHQVIDSVKMLRNFVQVMRSGVLGSKSLGYLPRKEVRNWLDQISDEQLFKQSIGNNPSVKDLIKIVHPTPKTESRSELYRYFLDLDCNFDKLPKIVQDYERLKKGLATEIPDVPFQMLDSLSLEFNIWPSIAKRASWQMTRMNLNTFNRHRVFEDPELIKVVSERLTNQNLIAKAKVFPYQLLMAYKAAESVPYQIREALQTAMELATENVPKIEGNIVICTDVSGSMSSPVTGYRDGSSSQVSCLDAAALISATILRKNNSALVIPFEQDVVDLNLNPRDSIMTNSSKLASIGGGGTNCSAPLNLLLKKKVAPDLIVMISDNESWVNAVRYSRQTKVMTYFGELKKINPNLKMVCIDLTPNTTTQALESEDILNIGGFSDNVFEVINNFIQGGNKNWTNFIEEVQIKGNDCQMPAGVQI